MLSLFPRITNPVISVLWQGGRREVGTFFSGASLPYPQSQISTFKMELPHPVQILLRGKMASVMFTFLTHDFGRRGRKSDGMAGRQRMCWLIPLGMLSGSEVRKQPSSIQTNLKWFAPENIQCLSGPLSVSPFPSLPESTLLLLSLYPQLLPPG